MASTYVNLNKTIDNVIFDSSINGNFLNGIPRHFIIDRVRRVYETWVTQGITGQVKPLKLEVSDQNTIKLPDDYIRYYRLSYINDFGKLVPIGVSSDISISNGYLLDHNNEILLDSDSIPITGSADNDIDRTKTRLQFDSTWQDNYHNRRYYESPNLQNINPSFDRSVEFKEDLAKGVIQLQGKKFEYIVLEYAYNPFANTVRLDELKIKTVFSRALEKETYSDLISNQRAVSPFEKVNAAKAAKKAILEAKIAGLSPALNDIISTTNSI